MNRRIALGTIAASLFPTFVVALNTKSVAEQKAEQLARVKLHETIRLYVDSKAKTINASSMSKVDERGYALGKTSKVSYDDSYELEAIVNATTKIAGPCIVLTEHSQGFRLNVL